MSENSVGKAAVSGILCQREAEPVRCGAVESPLASKPGSNFAFANPLVSVRVSIGIQKKKSSLSRFRAASWPFAELGGSSG